jgi:hypothetical protein
VKRVMNQKNRFTSHCTARTFVLCEVGMVVAFQVLILYFIIHLPVSFKSLEFEYDTSLLEPNKFKVLHLDFTQK